MVKLKVFKLFEASMSGMISHQFTYFQRNNLKAKEKLDEKLFGGLHFEAKMFTFAAGRACMVSSL